MSAIFNENKSLPAEHLFKGMQLLEHIVNEFEKNQIESVAMRYFTNHIDQLYGMYKSGFICNLIDLHDDKKNNRNHY